MKQRICDCLDIFINKCGAWKHPLSIYAVNKLDYELLKEYLILGEGVSYRLTDEFYDMFAELNNCVEYNEELLHRAAIHIYTICTMTIGNIDKYHTNAIEGLALTTDKLYVYYLDCKISHQRYWKIPFPMSIKENSNEKVFLGSLCGLPTSGRTF